MKYTWVAVTVALFLSVLHSSDASLEAVSKDTFQTYLKSTKYLLVLFYYDVETCPRCVDAIREVEKIETPDLYDDDVKKIKCEDPGTAVHYGITTVPQVIFFRDGVPALYDIPADMREIRASQLQSWIEMAQQVATQTLTDESFEHLTQASTGATTGDWLVMFYRDSCQGHLPALEGAGVKIRQKMNTAKVNIDKSPNLAVRFHIKDCPTTYYFRQGEIYQYDMDDPHQYYVYSMLVYLSFQFPTGFRQGKMYLYDVDDPDQYYVYSISLLISFVTSWYKNVKSEYVPKEPTVFDRLTESIADYIKEQMNGPNRNHVLLMSSIGLAVIVFVTSVILVTCCKKKDQKTE